MAYCENCGNELSDQAVACTKCGHPRAGGAAPAFYATARPRRTEGTAVTALVLGILGIIACPLLLSIPAIILGNQAKSKIRSDPSLDGEGMANAGVILGWVGVGIGALGLILILASIGTATQF